MRKKIIILLIIILLIIIIFFLSLSQKGNSNYEVYKCSTRTTSGTDIENNYSIYYEKETNKVKAAEIIKTYRANNSNDRNNLVTLKSIIEQENNNYKTYKGIQIKVLRNNADIYSYKYIVDVTLMNNEYLSMFEIYKTMEEQKKYFEEITCK